MSYLQLKRCRCGSENFKQLPADGKSFKYVCIVCGRSGNVKPIRRSSYKAPPRVEGSAL